MKTCPKCRKVYDDSWKICIKCNVLLTDKAIEPEREKDVPRDAQSEIRSIREAITKLNERVNLLEYNLKTRKMESEAPIRQEIAPEIKAAREELRIPEQPVFKKEEDEEGYLILPV